MPSNKIIDKLYGENRNNFKTALEKNMPDVYLDLLIKNENKIIEVKSEWTYKLHEKRNIAKKAECIKQGFKFEFWIFNNKKELTIL
jgi:hypothetical protein